MRLNPVGAVMDDHPDVVVDVIKEMRADGKGIVGMKILGQGAMRERPSQALQYALGNGVCWMRSPSARKVSWSRTTLSAASPLHKANCYLC